MNAASRRDHGTRPLRPAARRIDVRSSLTPRELVSYHRRRLLWRFLSRIVSMKRETEFARARTIADFGARLASQLVAARRCLFGGWFLGTGVHRLRDVEQPRPGHGDGSFARALGNRSAPSPIHSAAKSLFLHRAART